MCPTERTVLPAVFRHSQTLYDALDDNSEVEKIDEVPVKVFRGRITQIYTKLGISQSYYSQVTKALEYNGCVTYLQKGARGAESIIILHHPPKEDEWQNPSKGQKDRGAYGILRQQVTNIEKSLGGLDVKQALVSLQEQLTQLDSRVRELENGRK